MDYKYHYKKYKNIYMTLKGGDNVKMSYTDIVDKMIKFIDSDKVIEIINNYWSGPFSFLLLEKDIDVTMIGFDNVLEHIEFSEDKKYIDNFKMMYSNEAFDKYNDRNTLIIDIPEPDKHTFSEETMNKITTTMHNVSEKLSELYKILKGYEPTLKEYLKKHGTDPKINTILDNMIEDIESISDISEIHKDVKGVIDSINSIKGFINNNNIDILYMVFGFTLDNIDDISRAIENHMVIVKQFKGDKLIYVNHKTNDNKFLDLANKEWDEVDKFQLKNYSTPRKGHDTLHVVFYKRKGAKDINYKKKPVSKTSYKDISTDEYEFVHFNNTKDKQRFVKKHQLEILDMLFACIPPNINMDKLYYIFIKEIFESLTFGDLYCVTYNDKVIGCCQLEDSIELVKTNEKIKTYDSYCTERNNDLIGECKPRRIMKNSMVKKIFGEEPGDNYKELTLGNNTTRGPIIIELCKNTDYKNVGIFLINKLLDTIKSKHKTVYIAPESVRFKDNLWNLNDYNDFSFGCVYYDGYKKSNIKLIEYYEKLGFKVSDDLYYFESCSRVLSNTHPPSGQFVFHNVLYKEI